jgi:hypothetical protein
MECSCLLNPTTHPPRNLRPYHRRAVCDGRGLDRHRPNRRAAHPPDRPPIAPDEAKVRRPGRPRPGGEATTAATGGAPAPATSKRKSQAARANAAGGCRLAGQADTANSAIFRAGGAPAGGTGDAGTAQSRAAGRADISPAIPDAGHSPPGGPEIAAQTGQASPAAAPKACRQNRPPETVQPAQAARGAGPVRPAGPARPARVAGPAEVAGPTGPTGHGAAAMARHPDDRNPAPNFADLTGACLRTP